MAAMIRALCLGLFLLPAAGFTAPLYFTFQGNLDYTFGSEASGVIPDQPVTYVFVADREAPGSITEANGTVTWRVDDAQYDYYFADLYYASIESPGIYQSHLSARNYGRDTLSSFDFPEPTSLFTRNQTLLHLSASNLFELETGVTLDPTNYIDVRWINAGQRFSDPDSLSYFAVHGLRLVEVSTTAPVVPVPAAAGLLLSGLGVLMGLRRRR